jgi:WD40 repeat protein
MAKLFVSYSRKDSVAARKLIDAFKSIEQEVWVDWESIPPAVDWLEQIFGGIEQADAFVFMVSPDSIASEVCKVEIGHAVKNNKRIIPIVLRDVKPQDAPENIRKLNWTFIREGDNFEEGLAKVRTAVELDLDWLEEHRRLQIRALEWHRKKDVSLLLRGRDLRNALHMVETYTSKDPTPTDLQRKYIEHSRKTERNRTIAWIATAIAVVALAILSYTTYLQSVRATKNAIEADKQAQIAKVSADEARKSEKEARKAQQEAERERQKAIEQEKIAKDQERVAQAQRSAARAQIYQTRTGELYTSTLLALESWEKSPSDEAEQILRENISLLPLPVAQAYQNASITALEFSPDGNTFLTASADGSACVRNLNDAKDLFCATSSTSINDAIFVSGGKSIAVGDEAGLVQILDATNGAVIRKIEAGSPIRDLDVSPNGKDLALARANGNITILSIDNTEKPGYSLHLSGKFTVATFSPNGRWYAAGSDTGVVTVWNLNTNKIFSGSRHRGTVFAIRFSPNSRFVVSGGADNYAVGFDTQSGNQVFQFPHSDWVRDIAFAPDSAWLATASDDARVRVWDLSSGREELNMFQDGAITNLSISADAKWIATTGTDNTARVWSAYTGVEMFQIPLGSAGTKLSFTNDDQRLISGDENGDIGIWDISGMVGPVKYIQFDDPTWIAKFTPTGNTLIASDANRVWLLDPQRFSTPQARPPQNSSLEFKNDIYDLAVSPNGQAIGISTYENEYIIYNLKSLIPIRVNPAGDAYALAFSADGSRFITGTNNGIIETWDVKTGKQINSFDEGDTILCITAGAEGVAAGTKDKIILLDANATQKVTEWEAPGENQFLAFNGDGSLLASANTSGQIEIWKKGNTTFELQSTITGEKPYSLAFNPQSNMLALGTVGEVYLIDAASGEEISRLAHKGDVYSVSFSADGKTMATAALKMIQLWDVSELQKPVNTDLVQMACSRLIENFSKSEWNVMFAGTDYVKLCANLPIPE